MIYDIVGCGAVVQSYHLPVLNVLRTRGDLAVAGCYDPNVPLAREIAGVVGAGRAESRPQPRADDGVDAVLVTAPPSAHADIAAEYIDAGKSVFVEKPFTTTAKQAVDLVAAAQSRGVSIAVNHYWRYYPSIEIARRWLNGHAIDSVLASDGHRMGWATLSEYVVRDPYGGAAYDAGSHLLDAVLYLRDLDESGDGGVFEIADVAKAPSSEPSQECRAGISIHDPGGDAVNVDLTVSRLRPLPRGLRISGDFGILFISGECAPAPILFRGDGAFRLRGAEAEPEATSLHACFLLAHEDFGRMVRAPETPTRIDASRFVLLARILESLHRGGG